MFYFGDRFDFTPSDLSKLTSAVQIVGLVFLLIQGWAIERAGLARAVFLVHLACASSLTLAALAAWQQSRPASVLAYVFFGALIRGIAVPVSMWVSLAYAPARRSTGFALDKVLGRVFDASGLTGARAIVSMGAGPGTLFGACALAMWAGIAADMRLGCGAHNMGSKSKSEKVQ